MARILGLIALIIHTKVISSRTLERKKTHLMGPVEIYELSKDMYQMGDITGAEAIFADNWDRHGSNELFQKGYLSILMETGQYRKMVILQNIVGSENLDQIEKAKKLIGKLDTKDPAVIAELIYVSPDSLDANLAFIINFMNSGDMKDLHKAKERLLRMERIYPTHEDVEFTRIELDLFEGNLELAINKISKFSPTVAKTAKSEYDKTKKILEHVFNVNQKLVGLADVRRELLVGPERQKFRNDRFNLLTHLYNFVLLKIVEIGCSAGTQPMQLYAKELLERQKNAKSLAYYIKSLIIEKDFTTADSIIQDNIDVLKSNGEMVGLLEFYNIHKEKLKMLQAEREKQRRLREEQEKQRQEKEKRQQEEMQRRNLRPTDKAGTDFLGYYKLLNIDPKKKVTSSELNRKRLKKLKEVAAKVNKKKNLTQEQKDSEAMFVNKAYEVLSDPKKKEWYDHGIDPEKGPELNYQGHNSYNGGGGFFDEDQMNDIFQAFFGGGSRGGRYQRRTQFIFM